MHIPTKKKRIVVAQKICKKCGRLLDISFFDKCKTNIDGHEGKCKECRKAERKKYIRTCLTCGKQFRTSNRNANYCSNKCGAQPRKQRMIVKCCICGKEKEIVPSGLNHAKRFYCSTECRHKGDSILFKGENSVRYSQVTVECEICGKRFKRTKSQVEQYSHNYCSKECQYKGWVKNYSGINSLNWDPNITMEERIKKRHFFKYKEWRREVYKRDNYTCQCCGDNRGHNLRAHHILNYSEHKELRLDLNNGITLCNKCHKKFHDTYGYTHNNKEQLKEFFKINKNKIACSGKQAI